MNGPEHYAEAERLLILAGSGADPRDPLIVASAQVHAILALAAASGVAYAGEMPLRDHDAWMHVAGAS